MSTYTVLCPDPDVDETPIFVGSFDSVERAEIWLEAEHCNQLAEIDGERVRICADGATVEEHLFRFDKAA